MVRDGEGGCNANDMLGTSSPAIARVRVSTAREKLAHREAGFAVWSVEWRGVHVNVNVGERCSVDPSEEQDMKTVIAPDGLIHLAADQLVEDAVVPAVAQRAGQDLPRAQRRGVRVEWQEWASGAVKRARVRNKAVNAHLLGGVLQEVRQEVGRAVRPERCSHRLH